MIVEYEDKYLEDVKDLLVELEEYILTIDEDHLDQLHPDYRDKMTEKALQEVKEHEGKCFLYVEKNHAIGAIIGTIRQYDAYDYLDYTCPKAGVINELIVSKNIRGKRIGQQLMAKMESYFAEKECKYIFIDVFAYNNNAIKFYDKQGYHNRMHTVVKKIKTEEE
ncbi:MAG: GNAT family N-acetyltransferase [Bacilli bacterium]|nr:GNAT family N-acetyltransferase [Bacilli bacterium]